MVITAALMDCCSRHHHERQRLRRRAATQPSTRMSRAPYMVAAGVFKEATRKNNRRLHAPTRKQTWRTSPVSRRNGGGCDKKRKTQRRRGFHTFSDRRQYPPMRHDEQPRRISIEWAMSVSIRPYYPRKRTSKLSKVNSKLQEGRATCSRGVL